MTDAFVDKLWGELDAKRPILICPKCESEMIMTETEDKDYSGHCWSCDHIGNDFIEAVALTQSDLSALVERVRGEAKQERVETLADIRSMVAQIAGRYVADKKMKAKVLDKIDAFIAKEAR